MKGKERKGLLKFIVFEGRERNPTGSTPPFVHLNLNEWCTSSFNGIPCDGDCAPQWIHSFDLMLLLDGNSNPFRWTTEFHPFMRSLWNSSTIFILSPHLSPIYLVQFHQSCFLFSTHFPPFSLSLLLVLHSIICHTHRFFPQSVHFPLSMPLPSPFQFLLILLALFQPSCWSSHPHFSCFPLTHSRFLLVNSTPLFMVLLKQFHTHFHLQRSPFVVLWSLLLLFNCVTAFVKCFFIRHMAQHSFTSPRQRRRIIVGERAHISSITSHKHALRGMISVLCHFHGVPVCESFHCTCHNNTCNIPKQRMTKIAPHTHFLLLFNK